MVEKVSAIGIIGIVTYFISELLTYLFFDKYIFFFGENLFSLFCFILICLACSFCVLELLIIFALTIFENR